MRKQIESLYNKFFGQEVFIVAGGYSVKDININYLHDKNTVAVNDAYKLLPNATALFWCDTSWYGREANTLDKHNTKLRFHAKFNANVVDETLTSGGATPLLRTGTHGYDRDINHVMGNNSGTHCLNFVVNLGAKRIYLIGFDMRDNPTKRGENHWHDYHTLAVRPNIYSEMFVPSITALNAGIRASNVVVDIINCSKLSAITCFKKQTFAELVVKR
jgi:hypothetical protein